MAAVWASATVNGRTKRSVKVTSREQRLNKDLIHVVMTTQILIDGTVVHEAVSIATVFERED